VYILVPHYDQPGIPCRTNTTLDISPLAAIFRRGNEMVSKKEIESQKDIKLKMAFPDEEVVPRTINGINLFINEGSLTIDFFFVDITRALVETKEGPIRQSYLVSRVNLSRSMAEKLKKQIDEAVKYFKQSEEGK
jgi:hypothetical protein